MSKINTFSRVLNQNVKTRFFMDFQLMDNLSMTGSDTVIFWTEPIFCRKSTQAMLLCSYIVDWRHRYKYSTVVITNWLIVTTTGLLFHKI